MLQNQIKIISNAAQPAGTLLTINSLTPQLKIKMIIFKKRSDTCEY